MVDAVCIYIYMVLWKFEIQPTNQGKLSSQNIVRQESGRHMGHQWS